MPSFLIHCTASKYLDNHTAPQVCQCVVMKPSHFSILTNETFDWGNKIETRDHLIYLEIHPDIHPQYMLKLIYWDLHIYIDHFSYVNSLTVSYVLNIGCKLDNNCRCLGMTLWWPSHDDSCRIQGRRPGGKCLGKKKKGRKKHPTNKKGYPSQTRPHWSPPPPPIF